MKHLADTIVRAEAYKDSNIAPVTLLIDYPITDTEAATCGVLFDNQADVAQVLMEGLYRVRKLQIRATGSHGNLWIPRMRLDYSHREYWDDSLHGVAELLVEGKLDDFQGLPGTLKCYVLLQDNALSSLYYEENLITWSTPFGEAKLIHDYRFGGYVGDMRERKPFKRDMIEIELDAGQHKSLYDLITALSAYLDDLMWLISFLSKKYVHWYQFDMYYEPQEQASEQFRVITAYREPRLVKRNPSVKEPSGFENHPGDLLINLKALGTNVAQDVFRAYDGSIDKSVIRSLIITTMMTYPDVFFEQQLGIIYTALEMLVNTYTKRDILGSNQSDKLASAFRKFLAEQDKVNLTEEQQKEITKKIPELTRYSYATRLESLFKEKLQAIPPQLAYELTPEILMEQLIKAVKRRDDFIHKGEISDWDQSSGDFALIRFLVSLYILALLNYPLDQINVLDPDLMMLDWALQDSDKRV